MRLSVPPWCIEPRRLRVENCCATIDAFPAGPGQCAGALRARLASVYPCRQGAEQSLADSAVFEPLEELVASPAVPQQLALGILV